MNDTPYNNSLEVPPRRDAALPKASRVKRSRLPGIDPARRLSPIYSRAVLMGKLALPVVAFGLVAIIALWPYLQKEEIASTIGFLRGAVGEQGLPTMVNPRYTGVDKDNQPFAVTADIAHNLVLDTTHVELEMPKADITTNAGSWMVVTAETGVYDKDGKSLDLAGKVNLFYDEGYELNTNELHVDIHARTAESRSPVSGQGPIGDILSEGFRLNNVTRVIVFSGKARLILYPGVMGGG